MLQFRPVGDSPWTGNPFYSPARDIAHNGIALMSQAMMVLDLYLEKDNRLPDLLQKLGVKQEDLAKCGSQLGELLKKIPEAKELKDLVSELQIDVLDNDALLILYAFIGYYFVLSVFSSIRDLSEIPASVKEFIQMVEDVREKVESGKNKKSLRERIKEAVSKLKRCSKDSGQKGKQ